MIIVEGEEEAEAVPCLTRFSCAFPLDQTLEENTSWTQYGSTNYERPPMFTICTNKVAHSIYIYIGSSWVLCSGITPIALASGGNLQNQYAKKWDVSCNATLVPHAIWYLRTAIGSGGQSYQMRVNIEDLWYSEFIITVNAPPPFFVPRINKFNRKRSFDNEL